MTDKNSNLDGNLPLRRRRERLGQPYPQQIVVVRALPGLGDFLCTVPALRALRQALPQAQITLLSLAGQRPLAHRFSHYLDDFLDFSGFPGIVEQPPRIEAFPSFLEKVHARQFDLALQMHGSGEVSNLYTLLLGAGHTAGFYLPPHYCHDPQLFLPYPNHLPEVRRNLALLAFLGIPDQGEQLEFPLLAADRDEFEVLAARHQLRPGAYVCLHAGAKDEARRWPAARFAQVADRLAEQDLEVVLTGTAAEATLTKAVAARMDRPALDLSGQTGLGALAVLLAQSRLLICNDTGVSHLAAAMKVPSVIIFSASDPARWAPLNRRRHLPVGQGEGKERVTPEQVWARAKELLEAEEVPAHG